MNRRVDIIILGQALPEAPIAQAGTPAQSPAAPAVTPPATPPAKTMANPPPAAALRPAAVRTAGGSLQQ
jgi:hypothetical protein